MDELLALAAVADDVLDRDDRHRELLGDGLELLGAGHAVTLAAADLAQHARPERDRRGGRDRRWPRYARRGAARRPPSPPARTGGRGCGSPRAGERGSSTACTVRARSAALMPVWQVLVIDRDGERRAGRARCCSRPSSRSPSPAPGSGWIGMQKRPPPWRVMKCTISGVTFSAAQMKSPSSSRSAASTTITMRPCGDRLDRLLDGGQGMVAARAPVRLRLGDRSRRPVASVRRTRTAFQAALASTCVARRGSPCSPPASQRAMYSSVGPIATGVKRSRGSRVTSPRSMKGSSQAATSA